jgi:uncharacterized protein (TIGR00251 family)
VIDDGLPIARCRDGVPRLVIQLALRVIPRSSKPGIAGVRDGALIVRLQAPPVDGAANEELIDLIAKIFGVARRDVSIVSGERSKLKRVALPFDRATADATLRSLGINPDDLKAPS